MELATVFEAGMPALYAKFGSRLGDAQRRALGAVRAWRTGALGHAVLDCGDCGSRHLQMRCCANRSCPRCQQHSASAWLERQHNKLLPVAYFLVTFTLPAQLRGLAQSNQRIVYDALFEAASQSLIQVGLNRTQALRLGLCAVLHTHSRRLDYHPHLHVVVPGGGIDPERRQWRAIGANYLFAANNLAKVFRAKMIRALARADLALPPGVPGNWVVDCRSVGQGLPALNYLSRYLYRGVVAENNIVGLDTEQGTVTFQYRQSNTEAIKTRTLPIAEFLYKLLQHVLPKGYRGVRDFGFLHGNAKRLPITLQIALRVILPDAPPKTPRVFSCRTCGGPMVFCYFVPPRAQT
ncbi:MAG: transposase [Acidiferrobacterales bacterium]